MVWGVVIVIVIIIIIGFYSALGSSDTTFRLISNQWISNSQLGDMSNQEIYNLILRNRYRIREGERFPDKHEKVINDVKRDIVSGMAFYETYSLTLTLYTIFKIEGNKKYINSDKYQCTEDIFEAISSVIKKQANIAKYGEY